MTRDEFRKHKEGFDYDSIKVGSLASVSFIYGDNAHEFLNAEDDYEVTGITTDAWNRIFVNLEGYGETIFFIEIFSSMPASCHGITINLGNNDD